MTDTVTVTACTSNCATCTSSACTACNENFYLNGATCTGKNSICTLCKELFALIII